MIMATGG